MPVCGVKVGNTKRLNYSTNSNHKHLIRVSLVFPCISYRRNILEMILFQKHEVSYSETKRCLRVCIEKIASRCYMYLSVATYKLLPSQCHCHQTNFRNKS